MSCRVSLHILFFLFYSLCTLMISFIRHVGSDCPFSNNIKLIHLVKVMDFRFLL